MSRQILDVLKRHAVKAQLWVLLDFGADKVAGAEQTRRVEAAAAKLKPLAVEAAKIGCTLGLYNHGGWFGEPENQLAILERLKKDGVTNVGMVYNLHHGHDHLDRFAAVLPTIKPYLFALNLNGTDRGGDRVGRKILPLGQGEMDLELLKTILASGYRGPIGILGHTQDDAEGAACRTILTASTGSSPNSAARPPARSRRPALPCRRALRVLRKPPWTPLIPSGSRAFYEATRAHMATRDAEADVFASPKLACVSCQPKWALRADSLAPTCSAVGICTPPRANRRVDPLATTPGQSGV